jgi:hypothetical protein
VTTPGYWQKKAKGLLLPDNPFQLIRGEGTMPFVEYFKSGSTTFTINWKGLSGTALLDTRAILTTGQGLFSLPAGESVGSGVKGLHSKQMRSISLQRTLCTNKLSKKLGSRDIDLGVALGEARETAHFVQSAMIKCFVAAKHLRRGDVSGALRATGYTRGDDLSRKQSFRDVLDAAASTQLSLTYAVKPLLADVFGAVTALEKRNEIPWIKTVRASASDELDVKLSSTGHLTADNVWDQYYEVMGGYETRAALTFQVDNPFLYSLSQLGLLNPLNLAWELTTLSFVADWFLPIGDWFNGMVPPQGASVVSGHLTSRLKARGIGEILYRTGPDLGRKTVVIPVHHFQDFKWREKLSAFPRYRLVGANFDLSKQQVMSGLSLLWSFGGGRKSEAKAYNDAVALNSRGIGTRAGAMSREKWGGSPFPSDYSRL